jgi:hypothetical protein
MSMSSHDFAAALTNDRYQSTLHAVDVAALDMNTELRAAQDALTDTDRHRSLINLYNRARDVACLVNHALGGWPAPPGGEDRP